MDEKTEEGTTPDGRWILRTRVGPFVISTVDLHGGMGSAFIGMVDSMFGEMGGRWETMVFVADDASGMGFDPSDQDCERYDSQDDARAGHRRMIEKWTRDDEVTE